jgi:hypothetical protein
MSIVAGKIKYERGFDRISKTVGVDKEEEKQRLHYIENKIGDQMACMFNLSMSYEQLSSKNLLIEKDIKSHRYNIYISAKLALLSCKVRERFLGGVAGLFSVLESNNQDFIKFIMNNIEIIAPDDWDIEKGKYTTLTNSKGYRFFAITTILALKGDFEEVKKRCKMYLENPLKSSEYKYREYECEFLKGLAEKNIEEMKKAVDKMMNPKVAKKMLYDLNPNYDFYLHIYVIIYSKIALYHGIELGVDNEVAPKELIDNTPLEKYEDPYEFMKSFDLATITPDEWKKWTFSWPFRAVE